MPKARKPKKPYSGFPLFAHASKQWAKKLNGRMHYFGVWDDPDAALKKFQDQQAGHTSPTQVEGVTVRELVNRFLTAKKALMTSGEIPATTACSLGDSNSLAAWVESRGHRARLHRGSVLQNA